MRECCHLMPVSETSCINTKQIYYKLYFFIILMLAIGLDTTHIPDFFQDLDQYLNK